MHYIRTKKPQPRCPVAGNFFSIVFYQVLIVALLIFFITFPIAPLYLNYLFLYISRYISSIVICKCTSYSGLGCPRILQAGKVECDPLLRGDLEELRLAETVAVEHNVIEDFTELDED
jgi:hypothetical protein